MRKTYGGSRRAPRPVHIAYCTSCQGLRISGIEGIELQRPMTAGARMRRFDPEKKSLGGWLRTINMERGVCVPARRCDNVRPFESGVWLGSRTRVRDAKVGRSILLVCTASGRERQSIHRLCSRSNLSVLLECPNAISD